jgi:hypothetical protein
MKTTSALCVLSFATVLVTACGGGGLKPGGNDGGADQGVADMTMMSLLDMPAVQFADIAGIDFKGVACGNQTCGTGESCCISPNGNTLEQTCVTGSSCTSDDGGTIDATCDGPEDCASGTPNCCADISIGGGSPSGGAMCTASCPASAGQGGGAGISTKLCHNGADCVGYSGSTPLGTLDFDSCCTYAGVSYSFCAPSLITGLAQGITCQP